MPPGGRGDTAVSPVRTFVVCSYPNFNTTTSISYFLLSQNGLTTQGKLLKTLEGGEEGREGGRVRREGGREVRREGKEAG